MIDFLKFVNRSDEDKYNMLLEAQAQINKLEKVLKKIRLKCKEPKKEMDFTIWLKLRNYIETLEDFEKDIEYNLHPIITIAYKCNIKNSIKELCHIIKYKLVYKEDIKDIINELKDSDIK